MVKVNEFLDLFFHNIFYKNKFVVHVKKSNNNVEKHYYEVDKENRVLIYPANTEENEDNPYIKSSVIHFDSKHKSPILLWREGEDYAYPLFGDIHFDSQKIDSQYGSRMVNLGKKLQELNNPILKLNRHEGIIIWIVLGSLVLGLINAFMVYQLAQNLGVNLLS